MQLCLKVKIFLWTFGTWRLPFLILYSILKYNAKIIKRNTEISPICTKLRVPISITYLSSCCNAWINENSRKTDIKLVVTVKYRILTNKGSFSWSWIMPLLAYFISTYLNEKLSEKNLCLYCYLNGMEKKLSTEWLENKIGIVMLNTNLSSFSSSLSKVMVPVLPKTIWRLDASATGKKMAFKIKDKIILFYTSHVEIWFLSVCLSVCLSQNWNSLLSCTQETKELEHRFILRHTIIA